MLSKDMTLLNVWKSSESLNVLNKEDWLKLLHWCGLVTSRSRTGSGGTWTSDTVIFIQKSRWPKWGAQCPF